MAIAKLHQLRDQVESALASKITETRRDLESQLAKLNRFGGGSVRGPRRDALHGTTVAPKYRNPANPSETWAGRGLRPRWLVAALKTGKKLEAFSVDKPVKRAPKKAARKAKVKRKAKAAKARKPRKANPGRPASPPEPTSQASPQAS
jgi:DNA-binding protein H-NS